MAQTSFAALDEAIKLTNRRVNALDNVVIPRIVATIAYIDSELSEIEREEIFRCVGCTSALRCCVVVDVVVIACWVTTQPLHAA